MQKLSLVQGDESYGISLTAGNSSGSFRILDTVQEDSISCRAEVSGGLCIDLPASGSGSGENISVLAVVSETYRIVESLAGKFTAVIHGIFCVVSKHTGCIRKFFRRLKELPVRPRMTQLAFAGGLRL